MFRKKKENNKNIEKKEMTEREKKFERFVGSFVIALVIFALAFGSQFVTTVFQVKVEYNDFQKMVEAGEIEQADINASSGKVLFYKDGDMTTYYTNYPYSDDFSENLLKNNVDIKIRETNWLMSIFNNFGSFFLLGFFMFMMLRMQNGGFDFAVEPVSDIKIRFDDIAGMNEIKEDMLVLSNMMKDDKYKKSGARVPKGVLLQGPPGNGKTLLARAFAGETGVNFIAINACDLGSQFVGIGSNKIKKVFDVAKKNAPCVIFIDEIDSVGSKRATSSDAAGKEMNTMLTALLNQMDGFEQMDNVMVLAATNRAEDLDEALVRPGRFDRQFIVDYPDKKTRKELFEIYTKKSKMSDDVDFDKLASRTFGYSSSKIECIINEALILSVTNGSEVVTQEDFENAILQMDIKGKLKENNEQNDKEREIVAYHEAGHAVLGYFLTNKRITRISIVPTTSGAGGFTITEDEENVLPSLNEYKNKIAMMYGGRAAEVVLKGSVEGATAGAMQDINQITQIASQYVGILKGVDYSVFGKYGVERVMEMTEEFLPEVWDKALKTANQKFHYIKAVAEYLLQNENMEEEEFYKMIKSLEELESLSSDESKNYEKY